MNKQALDKESQFKLASKYVLRNRLLKRSAFTKAARYVLDCRMLKKATGINSNYLLSGGAGLLSGLALYHFLNDEKKRSLGGYIGAGLTGLGTGLLGAGAYNHSQYGKLLDMPDITTNPEEPANTPDEPIVPPVDTTSTPEVPEAPVAETGSDSVVESVQPDTNTGGAAYNIGSRLGQLVVGPAVQVANGAAQATGLPADWGNGWNYNGLGNLGLATGLSAAAGAATGAGYGAAERTANSIWNNGLSRKPLTVNDRIKRDALAQQNINERAETNPYRPRRASSKLTAIPSYATSPFRYFFRVGNTAMSDYLDKRNLLTEGQRNFVNKPEIAAILKPNALDSYDATDLIKEVFRGRPEEAQLEGAFEEGKKYSRTPEDFGGSVPKQRAYNKLRFLKWLAGEQPDLFKNDLELAQQNYDNVFNPKPAEPSKGTKLLQKGKDLYKNTTTGVSNLLKKLLTKKKVTPVKDVVPPIPDIVPPIPEKPVSAPKPNSVTGNNAPTSPLNKAAPKPNANWVNGESNFGGQLNKTYQEIFGGKPIGDQFVENSSVSPVKAPEAPQGNTDTSEAQKRTETVQNKQPRTEADELRESRAKWKPLEGSHFDENYHVVVDDPGVYREALEKDKAAIDKKLSKPDKLEVNERRALEQRKTWIGKTLDRVIRVGEKIVEVGKPVIRAAERAGRHL